MMTDPVRLSASPAPAPNASQFLTTFAAVLLSIAVLLVVDTALARVDRRESTAHAEALYTDGRALLVGRHPAAAVEHFASAVAIERSNVQYQIALGDALLADGRLADAEATLTSALSRAGTYGSANLAMARVLRREGRTDDAKSFYHRAIYGRWGADSMRARTDARLELITLLAAGAGGRELLAELLPYEEVMPDSMPLRRRVAHLFIKAGSPARGVRIFRALLKQNPSDGDAYAGMGEAALSLGNFRTARADFVRAAQLAPGDGNIPARISLTDTVLALNPLERGLDPHARYVRAREILVRTVAVDQSCPAPRARRPASDAVRQALSDASPRNAASASDGLLALASDLYADLPAHCVRAAAAGEALALIQSHLLQ